MSNIDSGVSELLQDAIQENSILRDRVTELEALLAAAQDEIDQRDETIRELVGQMEQPNVAVANPDLFEDEEDQYDDREDELSGNRVHSFHADFAYENRNRNEGVRIIDENNNDLPFNRILNETLHSLHLVNPARDIYLQLHENDLQKQQQTSDGKTGLILTSEKRIEDADGVMAKSTEMAMESEKDESDFSSEPSSDKNSNGYYSSDQEDEGQQIQGHNEATCRSSSNKYNETIEKTSTLSKTKKRIHKLRKNKVSGKKQSRNQESSSK